MRENKLYVSGKLAYSFGKNGKGLSDEFETINSIIKLFSKDNYITIHKTFVDQIDDVYDIVFDISPRENVNYLLKDNEVEES